MRNVPTSAVMGGIKPKQRNCLVNHVKQNGSVVFPVLNGKQLKVSVVKLHGNEAAKPSVPLFENDNNFTSKTSQSKYRTTKKRKLKTCDDKSDKETGIKLNPMSYEEDSSHNGLGSVTETSINNKLDYDCPISSFCCDCSSSVDSPQSSISQDANSQTSDCDIGKSRQCNNTSCSALCYDSLQSDKKLCSSYSNQDTSNCKWTNCSHSQVDLSKLQEHIKQSHIYPQVSNGSFVCLWIGCKVYNKPALSQTWLERHILHHSGEKPFKCIIGDCGLRFSSRYWLENHVRAHFEACDNLNAKGAKLDNSGGTPNKQRKRKLKKRITRPVKTEDFFNRYVMENIKNRFLDVKNDHIDLNSNEATFRSSVIGKREEPTGTKSVLVHWTPSSMLPDEWVPENEVKKVVTIPLSQLHLEAAVELDPAVYNQHRYRKHRRK